MAYQPIIIENPLKSDLGDDPQNTKWKKINANFAELYAGGSTVLGVRNPGKPMSVACIGDSLTVRNNFNLDLGAQTAAQMYASTLRSVSTVAWLTHGAMRSGGAWFQFEFCVGQSGATSTTILANCLPALLGVGTLGGAYVLPNKCIVLAGTNDPGAAISQATTIANLNSMYQALYAAGIDPIAMTCPPLNSNAALIEQLNYAIIRNARQVGVPCIDIYSALVDTTNANWIAGYTADGTHPNPLGSAVWGYVVNQAITALYGSGKGFIPALYDNSAITYYNRNPSLNIALGAGSINTAGSYPGQWNCPHPTESTVWNPSGVEPGTGLTMRTLFPAIANTTPNYLGYSWSLKGDGTNGVLCSGTADNQPSVGQRIALYVRFKWLPNASSPTHTGDFFLGTYDSSNGGKYFGFQANNSTANGNVQIGGETAYPAADFYYEKVVNAAMLASSAYHSRLNWLTVGDGVETGSNTGDSLTIANMQVINLTAAGLV